MARNRIRGDAPAVSQVSTFEVTAAGTAGDTVLVPISNKGVIATVPAAPTTATVAAAIAAALSASTFPEIAEVVWTSNGAFVIATANTPGMPFTIGTILVTGTVTTGAVSETTASRGPNHWDDPNNWSLLAVPVSTDDVDLIECDVDLKWGLAQSGVTLASLNIHSTYTGKLGLDSQNGDYAEYRPQELSIGATLITIGAGDGTGSALMKINTGSVQTTGLLQGTSTAGLQGLPALWWRGTHASNSWTVTRGVMGIAFGPGQVATVLTLNVGSRGTATDAQVTAGAGVTLGTLTMTSGQVTLFTSATTIEQNGGELTLGATGMAITTLTCRGGTVNVDGTGTITTTTLGSGALLVCDRDPRVPKTFTNITCNGGAGVKNGNKTATWTNGVVLNCTIDDVSPHEFGDILTITVA